MMGIAAVAEALSVKEFGARPVNSIYIQIRDTPYVIGGRVLND